MAGVEGRHGAGRRHTWPEAQKKCLLLAVSSPVFSQGAPGPPPPRSSAPIRLWWREGCRIAGEGHQQ